VLNDCAQLILEELRGQHRQYVFTSKRGHSRRRLKHVIAASWRSARVRAAQKYREQFRTDSPDGSGASACTICVTHSDGAYGLQE
jgi:hypothetical protein